jgi:phosphopantetheinyl transferase (holo-ACP synthase)
MTSTGNDIVSLNAINITRTKQYRFYSKILSTAEKGLYNGPEFATVPFENFVWLLWSIKESAYKYLKRAWPDLVFIPGKFTVKQLLFPAGYTLANFEETEVESAGFDNKGALKGIVTFGTNTLYSRSLMYRELIVSVVNDGENFENTCWGIKLIDNPDPEYQATAVRRFLVNRLQGLYPLDELVVGKNTEGTPIVLKKGEELAVVVSLSHHECFVAYSFQLIDLPELRG